MREREIETPKSQSGERKQTSILCRTIEEKVWLEWWVELISGFDADADADAFMHLSAAATILYKQHQYPKKKRE